MYHIANVLDLVAPQNKTLPIIYDSPHSGVFLPQKYDGNVTMHDIRQSEDCFVDELFGQAPHHHAFFLKALFSRTYVDLNRAMDDVDASIFASPPNGNAFTFNPSEKSQAGHGLIWKQTVSGKLLYHTPLSHDELKVRIENYWQPYHRMLEKLYRRLYKDFHYLLHLNCHSMPSRALKDNVDIILGDGHGKTSDENINQFLLASFTKQGLKARMNVPYSGAYIVKNYANPINSCYNVQIEINRALYMDESNATRNQNFTAMQETINHVMADIADYVQAETDHDRTTSFAAE